MATMIVQQATPLGGALNWYSIVAGGDLLPNDGKTLLAFHKASGTALNVTLDTPKTVDGLPIDNPVVIVTIAQDRTFGALDPTIFNTAAGGVAVTYTGDTTGATYAAVSQ